LWATVDFCMYENFRSIGISHQTTPIEVRESLAFSESDAGEFLNHLKDVHGFLDLVLLSTCNRTEIYYTSDEDHDKDIIAQLTFFKGVQKQDVSRYFFHKNGINAVNHLYRVSMGLDAKVLGDIQISHQVKRAYQLSADLGLAGPFLHRIMHSIFYANKRVVQETEFRDGAASVSYAATELVHQFIENFSRAKILLLGIGEIGRDVADNLRGIEADVTISNRTLSKAENLAHILGFQLEDFHKSIGKLDDFDVIICSTSGGQLIDPSLFHKKSFTQKLVIDLAVPRSVDPDLENQPGFLLYNIDQIEEKTSDVLKKRKKAVADVELIVSETIVDLTEWAKDMEVSPTIKKLKSALEKIRQEEVARFLKKADDREYELVDKVTKNIIQKVIKLPVLQLKAACKRGEAETLVDVLNDLFDLENESKKTPAE
jgi:glutamyl-tRNA reductase